MCSEIDYLPLFSHLEIHKVLSTNPESKWIHIAGLEITAGQRTMSGQK